MPAKTKTKLSRDSKQSRKIKAKRAKESIAEREARLANDRKRAQLKRANETPSEREYRLQYDRMLHARQRRYNTVRKKQAFRERQFCLTCITEIKKQKEKVTAKEKIFKCQLALKTLERESSGLYIESSKYSTAQSVIKTEFDPSQFEIKMETEEVFQDSCCTSKLASKTSVRKSNCISSELCHESINPSVIKTEFDHNEYEIKIETEEILQDSDLSNSTSH